MRQKEQLRTVSLYGTAGFRNGRNRVPGRRKKGFTMAEMLIVVGIIGVLAGVAFIAVSRYLRSMTKLEYDGYAKEIFVAAQNHLSMAGHEGYLGIKQDSKYGTKENAISGVEDSGNGIYYFVYDADNVGDTSSVFNLMLPFGSVDNTIRAGGRYIVRYHRESAQVLDVFYWSSTARRFSHTYDPSDDYEAFLKDRDDKSKLKTYGSDKSVIGWYGGVEAKSLARGKKLLPPSIIVKNAERLTVEVTDPNKDNELKDKGALKLILTGLTSGNQREIVLRDKNSTNPGHHLYVDTPGAGGKFVISLDDITKTGFHFEELFCNGADLSKNLIPGENISIQAVAYNNEALTNIAYSSTQKTNSLFEDLEADAAGGTVQDTALIGNIRHLENLGNNVSCVDNTLHAAKEINGVTEPAIQITKARQTTDLDWVGFMDAIRTANGAGAVNVRAAETGASPANSGNNCFLPIILSDYALVYSGLKKDVPETAVGEERVFSISNIAVSESSGDGGLIGRQEEVTGSTANVSNLRLIDFSIAIKGGSGSAGALAGSYIGNVENVIVSHSKNGAFAAGSSVAGSGAKVSVSGSASGSAGGLIGTLTDGNVTGCAAAVFVESGSGDAGGLIGTVSSGSIIASYSGGHTSDGQYLPAVSSNADTNPYDVTSSTGKAGGLVGSFNGNRIKGSYSTCSVSPGTGEDGGGLAGSCVVSGKVSDCYATGLIRGSGAEEGATGRSGGTGIGSFAGSLTGTAENCHYYSIINYFSGYDPAAGEDPYLRAVGGDPAGTDRAGISALDSDTATFQAFSKATIPTGSPVVVEAGLAAPYDSTLVEYYQGRYPLRNIVDLDSGVSSKKYMAETHYGDWPSPELFFINTSS